MSEARPMGAGMAGILAIVLCSCASVPSSPPPPPEPVLYDWFGDGMSGSAEIEISLSSQTATIFLGGQYAGTSTVATGKPGHETPTGSFVITEKIVEKYSSHYGWMVDSSGAVVDYDADSRRDRPPPGGHFQAAPMPYWMRLTREGVGMHAGIIPEPGHPASKGCIRFPKAFAPTLFDRVTVGTPVRITQ